MNSLSSSYQTRDLEAADTDAKLCFHETVCISDLNVAQFTEKVWKMQWSVLLSPLYFV